MHSSMYNADKITIKQKIKIIFILCLFIIHFCILFIGKAYPDKEIYTWLLGDSTAIIVFWMIYEMKMLFK